MAREVVLSECGEHWLLEAVTGIHELNLAMNEPIVNLNAEDDENQASSQHNAGGYTQTHRTGRKRLFMNSPTFLPSPKRHLFSDCVRINLAQHLSDVFPFKNVEN
jgi:hypothetical protein